MYKAFWYDDKITLRQSRVIIKKGATTGNSLENYIIPSTLYPLNGPYKVFNCRNTAPITDMKLLQLIDQQEYCIGRCYTNTQKLTQALVDAGYNAKSYCGWLFTFDTQHPVHHCWTVVDGIHVVDLADDFTVMYSGNNGKILQSSKSREETAKLIASFQLAAREKPHSIRCMPIGTPTEFLLYVGSECHPEQGIQIYRDLMEAFPYHESSRKWGGTGMSYTQAMLASQGLMGWISE
jgi:hypothetical protein